MMSYKRDSGKFIEENNESNRKKEGDLDDEKEPYCSYGGKHKQT